MTTALTLAKYIIGKCTADAMPISNLQLQKILYYIQKNFLQERKVIAFSDDIEAWQFGPVVPNVYYHFSGFGAKPIDVEYKIDLSTCFDIEEIRAIDDIIESKRELFPWDMVAETHKNGGAWSLIFKGGRGNHAVIPTELIKEVG